MPSDYTNRIPISLSKWFSMFQNLVFNFHPLQIHIPLFFLLSGFCLTLGYGKKSYTTFGLCYSDFQTQDFLFGRASRILPVYYFCFLFALPLIPLGYSYFSPNMYNFSIGGCIASLFLVQTWILVLAFGPDGASWTVSTLIFFYLTFPRYSEIRHQCYSTKHLSTLTAYLFQLIAIRSKTYKP